MKPLVTRKVALIALFSALYYILSFLPGIEAIGVTNVTINIEAFMASIFGLIMGPYLGALTAFTGAFLAWILPPGIPSPTSAVFLPAPIINAFVVGLIYTGRWKKAFISFAMVVVAFWFLPPTQPWDQYLHVGFLVMWDKILALALIIPVAMLINKMRKKPMKVPKNKEESKLPKNVDLNVILSVIAAVLILINASMIALEGGVIKFQTVILDTTLNFNFGFKDIILLTTSYSFIWLLLGVGILTCAILLQFKPEKYFIWNSLIFTFSCLSVIIGGGFIIGLFLGVISGISGALKRRIIPFPITSKDMFVYFLLAFIGNQADNALGADIFAVPFVYEGIFGISSIETMRWLFSIAPFFYATIRFIQAIITALIAMPLIRNLKATGLSVSES